ncbi:MAG: hypothetical protein OHK0046_16640 [Anaerolineae bacterium]
MFTVKALNATEGRVGGYLVLWGDAATRDLQGEYFTPETQLGLDWYAHRPVLYQHGLDDYLKASVIGVIDTLIVDEVGVWAEAQLALHQRYTEAVQRLIARGVLSWSSGSLPHLVEVADDGRIMQWPIIEGSLTPSPAEPRCTTVQTIKSAYAALGLDTARLGIVMPIKQGETTMEQQTTLRRLPHSEDAVKTTSARIEVGSPYDGLEAADMLHGYVMLRAAKGFQGVSERYANALVAKSLRKGLVAGKAEGDLSATIVTGFGDDWVPDLWSAQIWQQARTENSILPLFRQIEMPSNPFELPIEGVDPTVYYVPETTLESELSLGAGNPIPDSKIGSDKIQLRASKLALRVGFSAELVEDAIVPVLNIYREQAMRAIANSIDHVLLNGDTLFDNAGNINTDSAAPNATDRFLAFDGVRKMALVTGGNAIDMAAAPTLAGLRNARFAMPARYAARPADLAWLVDGGTYAQLLNLEQFLTMDKAGALATAQTGQIGFIDGIPVLVSAEVPLTNADGLITVGGTNNKGSAVCVYRPGWFVGYRRRIAVNVDYLPYYDSYQLTATVRLAFASVDNDTASVLYNITV